MSVLPLNELPGIAELAKSVREALAAKRAARDTSAEFPETQTADADEENDDES